MNRREAAIITAYTGTMIGKFNGFHEYAEEVLDRPIWTHQFASKELMAELKQAAEADFIALNMGITT